jgi:DNA repair protein RecN (Recombination protein N)
VLLELRVENLLLIERAELELAPGLNVLTGETGAGKTVLAHALDLLLGGRARSGIVRPGSAEAYVEGVFSRPAPALVADLQSLGPLQGESWELLPADAQEIVLARRVSTDGRTRAYVNGRSATVGDLRRLGEGLLAFYGQHEHRKLTVAAAQLEILDGYCGPDQAARRIACAAAHRELRGAQDELGRLRELAGVRERELGLLEHELAEIEEADPQEDEYERLLVDRERLRRLDALFAAAGAGVQALVPDAPEAVGAVAQMAAAAARLDALAGVDRELDALAGRYRALAIEAEDLAGGLRGYEEQLGSEAFSSGPDGAGALQTVEERLAALERLIRKHGGTLRAVLEHAESARARDEQLRGAAVALEAATARADAVQATLERHVLALRASREAAAPRLAQAVREQLRALAMPDATFEVELSPREPGPTGGDGVELLIAPNPGVAAGPLREIASGGELSRVMLALTTCSGRGGPPADAPVGEALVVDVPVADAPVADEPVGEAPGRGASGPDVPVCRGELATARSGAANAGDGQLPTLVFDEIDAGIGGHTARAVGERLRELAEGRQVLCITHLPQIASLAARHFSIVKDTGPDLARTSVVRLGEPEVLAELVRMLGAPDGDTSARRHARELRKAA